MDQYNHRRKETVLIVDDDDYFVSDIVLLLDDKYYIVHASTTKQFHKAYNNVKIDIILCDIHLSNNESGIDILAWLNKQTDAPPVITMSDRPSVKLVVEAMNLGAEGFITKSNETKQLISTIEEVLIKYREQQKTSS